MKRDTTASTIDLIVLGFLLEKPTNAHDLVRLIEGNRIDRFLKISAPAVYKSCRRLYESGVLDGNVTKEGKQPEKTIYRINEKGRERFIVLMEHFSSLETTPYFLDLNVFIWNLERAGKRRGLKMLTKLRDELSNLKTWIIEHEKEVVDLPFANRVIVKQYRMTVSALLLWCEETLEEYAELKK